MSGIISQIGARSKIVSGTDVNVGIGQSTPTANLNIKSAAPTIILEDSTGGAFHGQMSVNGNEMMIDKLVNDKTSSATRFKIDINTGDTTVSAGDLIIGTSGKGIDFSATSDATGMSSEVLDDYEEGVHTMTIVGATSGNFVVGGYNTVAYTKIGRIVHCQGYIGADSDNSNSGAMRFSLPFTVGALSGDEGYSATAIMLRSHGGSFNQMFALTLENTAYFHLMDLAEDGTDTTATEAHVDASWSFYLNMTYLAQ